MEKEIISFSFSFSFYQINSNKKNSKYGYVAIVSLRHQNVQIYDIMEMGKTKINMSHSIYL